ncbi:MAG: hypothetical protein K2P84_07175, partial [Undibacterium sp.]|nr:hypothetical protein [Undibacterium sp.]
MSFSCVVLKGNQGKLHEQIGDFFEIAEQHTYHALDAEPHSNCEKNHGRIESPRVVALSAGYLEGVDKWMDLKTMVMVESMREIGTS